jgi:ABC-type sugar transport system ATPase subunit
VAQIQFSSLRKEYADPKGSVNTILNDIDLQFNDGEFVVLVGPSGCGKSTLLKCLVGLTPITAGQIHVGEIDVTSLPPAQRDIALVFQSYALYPHMTVAENMGFALKMAKVPLAERQQKVRETAELLGLVELLDRYPKDMSEGQRQRVAIGRAIVRRPKVFYFDEPLSNLNTNLRNQLRLELKKLHHQLQTTMVYVTHDQVEAMTLADRIVVLNKGIVQQVGSPEELYFQPSNLFVAGFIGSPSMNFFRSIEPGVVIGVRPHQVQIGSGEYEGVVEAVERLGFETLLHLSINGEACCARIETAQGLPAIGDQIAVGFHSCLRFDSKTERRID